MVWDKCNVTIHSASDGVNYTKNILTGSVDLEFKNKRKIEKIDIKVIGSQEIQWSRFSPTVPYIRMYAEKNNVLNVEFDSFDHLNCGTVSPGVYTYQFQVYLQSDLPSSYEDSVAKITYRVVVVGKNKGGFKKFQKIFPLTVISHLDLNNDVSVNYKVPLIFEATKKTYSGVFTLYLKTYRAFARHQRVMIAAILENKNKIIVNKITLTLVQKLKYNASSGFCDAEKQVCSISHTDILNKSEEEHRLYLDVPGLIPSTINLDKPMVDVSYALEAKVTFRCHLSLYCDIPVIVTSMPMLHIPF